MRLLMGGLMKTLFAKNRLAKAVATTALVVALVGPAALPALAQENLAEVRIRRMEAEIRALQRQVFPGGGDKFFTPEIQGGTATATPAAGQPATTPVTDLLTRMDALESQIARMTSQVELQGNRITQIEARLTSAAPAAATDAAATPAPAATANPAASASPAATPGPVGALASATSAAPAAAAVVPKTTASAAPAARATAPAARPAAKPSTERLNAVRAIEKPQSGDAGEDEYSYGFRLWEAKFYPEAQQQLKLMIDKYPRHARISFARNLLGRAYLDDNKPTEAAQWFLTNYSSNKAGDRASDSLLYLAEAMRRLNDTNRACIALAEFAETYSQEAAGRLKGQYDRTRSTVKCN